MSTSTTKDKFETQSPHPHPHPHYLNLSSSFPAAQPASQFLIIPSLTHLYVTQRNQWTLQLTYWGQIKHKKMEQGQVTDQDLKTNILLI